MFIILALIIHLTLIYLYLYLYLYKVMLVFRIISAYNEISLSDDESVLRKCQNKLIL